MPGSLVVISNDKFKSIWLGILMGRDPITLNRTHKTLGYIEIPIKIENFADVNESIADFFMKNLNKRFAMIESSAYFESYKHVLKKLQVMNSWIEMPL